MSYKDIIKGRRDQIRKSIENKINGWEGLVELLVQLNQALEEDKVIKTVTGVGSTEVEYTPLQFSDTVLFCEVGGLGEGEEIRIRIEYSQDRINWNLVREEVMNKNGAYSFIISYYVCNYFRCVKISSPINSTLNVRWSPWN